MGVGIRKMRRDDWQRVLEKDVFIRDFTMNGQKGKISLLKIRRVTQPLAVAHGENKVIIADVNYSWLQIALDGQFFWLTAMFDEEDRLLQIYIDMTNGNVASAENPYFEDMYLDYVVAGNRVWELDRDELDEAFHSGAITPAQYERTLSEGEKVFAYLRAHTPEVNSLVLGEYLRLKREAAVD